MSDAWGLFLEDIGLANYQERFASRGLCDFVSLCNASFEQYEKEAIRDGMIGPYQRLFAMAEGWHPFSPDMLPSFAPPETLCFPSSELDQAQALDQSTLIREVKILLLSTGADMAGERRVVKQIVMPTLNSKLKVYSSSPFPSADA